MSRYAVLIAAENGLYCASVPDLPGFMAVGRSEAEVIQAIERQVGLHVEGLRQQGVAPPPSKYSVTYIAAGDDLASFAFGRAAKASEAPATARRGPTESAQLPGAKVLATRAEVGAAPARPGVPGAWNAPIPGLSSGIKDDSGAFLPEPFGLAPELLEETRCNPSLGAGPGGAKLPDPPPFGGAKSREEGEDEEAFSVEPKAPTANRTEIQLLDASQCWWKPSQPQEKAATGDSVPAAFRLRLSLDQKNQAALDFSLIPKGWFSMGAPPEEFGRARGESLHTVKISRSYYISATPVTQGQWLAAMGTRPWRFRHAGPEAPVERVSWFDAIEFCYRLSELEGIASPYQLGNIERRDDGSIRQATVGLNPLAPGYRLPTEAEWERACRAGSSAPIYTGVFEILGENHSPQLDRIAWYAGNSGVSYAGAWDSSGWKETQRSHSRAGPHPVRQKAVNAFGLYDTLGNVWEWCWDWYQAYRREEAVDPTGEAVGDKRVFRGGCWSSRAAECRAASRCAIEPSKRARILGFRVVRGARDLKMDAPPRLGLGSAARDPNASDDLWQG